MVTGNRRDIGYKGMHWIMCVMIRYASGLCIHGKEASSSTTRRKPHSDILGILGFLSFSVVSDFKVDFLYL